MACLNQSIAYAVSVDGEVDQNTIHEHARGAIVNWLHLHVISVPDAIPDEHIRDMFIKVQQQIKAKKGLDVQLVAVDIKVRYLANAATVDLLAPALG